MEAIIQMFARLNNPGKRRLWNKIKADCETYPHTLVRIPIDFAIPAGARAPKEAWRSRGYLVQIYDVNENWERMSINRCAFDPLFTRFLDGITWDKIQELKAECGRGDRDAIEFYPADEDVVNVANLRHIWIKKSGSLIQELGAGWKSDSLGDAKPAVLDLITTTLGLKNSAPNSVKPETSPAIIDSAV